MAVFHSGDGGTWWQVQEVQKVTCQRKRSVGADASFRAHTNKKTGVSSFKQQNYNSSTSQQLMRLGAAHEDYSHRKTGRSRLTKTGRKTLIRTLPKWATEKHPEPPKGQLLDPVALRSLLVRASAFFAARPDFPCQIPRKALIKAATSK